ncbi:MAG: two-component sensor histidine kinase [Hyphomicrobiales bacterium]|nr:MAG: two-component sensor histidine kinase [Hyphomicrobiales bacterium]
MTAFGKLFRTTAFKLSIAYLAVFSAFAAFLIIYITYNTGELLNRKLQESIDQELLTIAEQYERAGIRRVTRMIDHMSRRPGAGLYLLTDIAGNPIAGNVESLPTAMLDDLGTKSRPVPYSRLDGDVDDEHFAIARVLVLPGGWRVMVGRDVGEREEFREIIGRAFRISVGVMLALGLLSWVFVSRRVLKRIDSISDTSRQIMAGDLSGRLQITGTGDEFDRLAEGLNAMLARIERLMVGLKEVSDNIAHDLKTPLTRLRNRVESALRGEPSEQNYREALEQTIEESEQLIKIFDALLKIARVEADAQQLATEPLDLGAIVDDVAELYEPVAEEAGFALSATVGSDLPMIRGNRELIGQALANLIDNALKYGQSAADDAQSTVAIGLMRQGDELVLSVADKGAGIPETERDRVAERFVRLEESRTQPGSGLGLSLVKAVAQMHGAVLGFLDNGPGLRVEMRFKATNGDGA